MEKGSFTGRGSNMSRGMKRRKNTCGKKKLTFSVYRGAVLEEKGALRGEILAKQRRCKKRQKGLK